MELNKSLNDSAHQIVSSKYCPELQHSTKEVNVWKAPGNCCEDSGYYSLSNPEHCEVYASNASYAKQTFLEDKTMKSNEHNEKMVHQKNSSHSAYDNSELISKGTVVSSPSGHDPFQRQYSYNLLHHPTPADLDNNANHIHHQKTTSHDLCTSCVSNYYTTVSNVNSNNNDKVIPCQSTGCNCTNNTNHQNLVKPCDNEVMGCISNETQSDYLDLAEKIEFCLVFGYTVSQIRHAIFKLGYKASKNDILGELTSMQNIRSPSGAGSASTSSDSKSHESGIVSRGDQPWISHGAEPDVDSDFLHNHERLLALGDDDKENEAQMEADDDTKNLRPIVIDGSNVAISHGNKQYFSCKGILLTVNYFRNRHHSDITVFVPAYRKEASRHEVPIKDREILLELEREQIVVFTPSRNINGKRVTCYDDRFILRLAQDTEAVIVSNDNFRDLQNEKQEWKELVEKRLLMYTFVNDRFMPPDDPLGRNGPNIDNFLRKRPASEEQSKPQCPYGRKCTYGKKCKYFHPECPRTISEKLVGKKSDNGRKKSKQVEAIAKKWIKQQHQVPSTSAVITSRQEVSQNNPSTHFTCAHSAGMHTGKLSSSAAPCDSTQVLTCTHQDSSSSCGDGGCLHNRIMPQRLSSHEAIQSHPYNMSGDNLLEPFRQLSVSSQRQRSPASCCCGHTNPQVCYEVRCQRKPFDEFRFHPHQTARVITEQSPPCLHGENPYAKRPYQLSSPANLEKAVQSSCASNPMLNHYWNVPHLYHHSPHFQSQYGVHPYSLRFVDPHFSSNHAQPPVSQPIMTSYQLSSHSQVSHGVHSNGIGSHAYVPSVNPSTGSNSSLSRSFPYLPVSDRLTDPSSHLGSASSHSDPRGYSFHVSSGYSANGLRKPVAAHAGPMRVRPASTSTHGPLEPSLNNESNPRYHLYRNLCGLYPPEVVGTIMKAHPDVNDPSKIIKLISQFR